MFAFACSTANETAEAKVVGNFDKVGSGVEIGGVSKGDSTDARPTQLQELSGSVDSVT